MARLPVNSDRIRSGPIEARSMPITYNIPAMSSSILTVSEKKKCTAWPRRVSRSSPATSRTSKSHSSRLTT